MQPGGLCISLGELALQIGDLDFQFGDSVEVLPDCCRALLSEGLIMDGTIPVVSSQVLKV